MDRYRSCLLFFVIISTIKLFCMEQLPQNQFFNGTEVKQEGMDPIVHYFLFSQLLEEKDKILRGYIKLLNPNYALFEAVSIGSTEEVYNALNRGANPNGICSKGELKVSALTLAVTHKNIQKSEVMVELLLNAGAIPSPQLLEYLARLEGVEERRNCIAKILDHIERRGIIPSLYTEYCKEFIEDCKKAC